LLFSCARAFEYAGVFLSVYFRIPCYYYVCNDVYLFEGGLFMAMKLYVYSHAVNVYILRYLGMPVEQFCELYGFNQGTVASWVTRERSVETLPASFIYALSLASSRNMGEIYEELLKLQEDYYRYRERVGFKSGKKVKKRLD